MGTTKIEPAQPGEVHVSYEPTETTMNALGDRLPHGLLTPEGAQRDFEFRPPTMGTRKQLGALKGRKDLSKRPGMFVAYWLAHALRSLCGRDLAAMKEAEAALLVARLTYGDILYLIFRWQQLGAPDGLELPAEGCGKCGAPFSEVLVDVGTLTVGELPADASQANPPRARLGLTRGFPMGALKVSTVLLQPPTWMDTFWVLSTEQWSNTELIRAQLLKASVCGVDAAEVQAVPMSAIDELWPVDVRAIDEATSRVTPTPDLRIVVPCPECGTPNETALDWRSADFFSGSARG